MSMIKKVIFFISQPLTLRDYKRLGVEVIRENGFEVNFFDFSPLMCPLSEKVATVQNPILLQGYYLFYNEKDAIRAISRLRAEDFVVMTMSYYPKTFRFYKALSRSKALYAVSATNAIPLPGNAAQDLKKNNLSNLFKKIFHITLPRLKNVAANFLYRPVFCKYLGVREPRLWFAGGVKSVDIFSAFLPLGKNTEILWSHSLDYDIYLEDCDTEIRHIDNKAVFLAVPGPQFRGDGSVLGGKSFLTKERYYPSLCRFFDMVEKGQKVRIEIAAHPRSNHESFPDYFGKRLTVSNMTCQMVKQSKFVITHDSTSVNFAVLWGKPIIFITTDEYEACPYGENQIIESIASSLEKKPINIDRQFYVDWDKELSVDKAVYSNYKHCFIKKEGSDDLNSWQIFANRLRRL